MTLVGSYDGWAAARPHGFELTKMQRCMVVINACAHVLPVSDIIKIKVNLKGTTGYMGYAYCRQQQLAQPYLFYIPVLISVHMTQEVNMKRLLTAFASV